MKHERLNTTTLPEGGARDGTAPWVVTLAHHDREWIVPAPRSLVAGSTLALQRDGGSFGAVPVDERVSRRHLRIVADLQGAAWLADQGSRNGVWRNRDRVTSVRLEERDALRVGGFVVLVEHSVDAPLARRASLLASALRELTRPPPSAHAFAELVLASERLPPEGIAAWIRALPVEPDVEALMAERLDAPRPVAAPPPCDRWGIASDARWVTTPEGELVDLLPRPVLMRLLRALLRSEHPVDVPALTAEIWPGARLVAESGAARVYAAVATLRRLGLRDVLVRREEGYCLVRSKITVVAVAAEL